MTLKRYKPFKRVSMQRVARSRELNEKKDRDHELFMEIWEERGGICEVTGVFLGEPLATMFHHLLPKSKYPEFRYCKWNIMLVAPDVHAQIESDISKVPVADQRLQELKRSMDLYDNVR